MNRHQTDSSVSLKNCNSNFAIQNLQFFLCFALLGAQEFESHLDKIKKAIDPKIDLDLDETLESVEALTEAKDDHEARMDAVDLLIKLINRKDPIKLKTGRSRVPPLMLLKSEAVRTLEALGETEAIEPLKEFQAREHNERYFPESDVERAIASLNGIVESKEAKRKAAEPKSDAWRAKWKKTEDGHRFLAFADQMTSDSNSEAGAGRHGLMHSGNPVVPFLVDCLLNHQNYVARRSSAYLLGQINDPLTVPDLVKALREPHENALWTIITSLGFMEDQRATDPVLPFLNHERKRIRVAAAQALVRLRDPSTVGILMKHMQKYKSGRNRARAAEALGEIGDRRAMPVLLKEMTGPHVVPREWAAMSYGKLATETGLEKLLERLVYEKMEAREVQLAFEEHYQADFGVNDKASWKDIAESFREQVKELKEAEKKAAEKRKNELNELDDINISE